MLKRINKRALNHKQVSPGSGELSLFLRVFFGRKVVIIGFVIIVVLILAAILAPVIAPYDPYEQDTNHTLAKPGTQHWLGTDTVGRDVLSRVIYGSRTSLIISLTSLIIAAGVGLSLGLIAGYVGGWAYTIIMRSLDALMTIPMIMLALTIAALLGGGFKNIIIALGIGMMSLYGRMMCGQVIHVKQDDYILAARSMGAKSLRIMLRHIAPNCFPPLIVMMTMQLGMVILAEASLSFLGIGIVPPTASWGGMVNEGRRFLLTMPVLSFAPGFAIMLVVFSFNMVGDGLRDALDPRLRGTI